MDLSSNYATTWQIAANYLEVSVFDGDIGKTVKKLEINEKSDEGEGDQPKSKRAN